jgi:serine/threonine-protein kinase
MANRIEHLTLVSPALRCPVCSRAKSSLDTECECGAWRPAEGWATDEQDEGDSHVLEGRFKLGTETRRSDGAVWYTGEATDSDAIMEICELLSPPEDDAWGRRYQHEAAIAQRVRHGGVSRWLGTGGTDRGTLLVVSEAPRGRTLAEVTGDGPLTADRALAITSRIARALRAIHLEGGVHGALDPRYIQLTSQWAGSEHTTLPVSGWWLCVTDPQPAFERWQAPEVRGGAAPTALSDVYALGLVLHRCVTGVDATGDSVDEIMSAVPRPLPEAVDRVLRALLHPEPAARIEDAALAAAAIEDARRKVAAAVVKAPVTDPTSLTPGVQIRRAVATGEVVELDVDVVGELVAEVEPAAASRGRGIGLAIAGIGVGLGLMSVALAVVFLNLGGSGDEDRTRPAPPEVAVVAHAPAPVPVPATVEPAPLPPVPEVELAPVPSRGPAARAVPTAEALPVPPAVVEAPPEEAPVEPIAVMGDRSKRVETPVSSPASPPEPPPPGIDATKWSGTYSGERIGRPFTVSLTFADGGRVSGVAKVRLGPQEVKAPVKGTWVERDGSLAVDFIETTGSRPARHTGLMKPGEGTGAVWVGGKERGAWSISR